MEENIEKILLSRIEAVLCSNSPFIPTAINGIPQSAMEIASHFREFMEWYFEDANNFFPQRDENDTLVFWDLIQNRGITLDELYNFWLKEVKK